MDTSTENLVDSLAIIKQLSYALRNHIENDNYKEVINTTTQLLQELRNGALSPKDYYEVFCEQLIFVEGYVCDMLANGVSAEELYEEVQYTSAFTPRLYLMILVASCCIRMKLIPAKKLLYDILDMSKGIQHPMRGLFLRNYFIREMKDKFPYPGCRYETDDGGDVNDSVDCIIRNFVEMNRLWIRMQNTKSRNKDQREKQRNDLKVLVGTNFVVLSQLEGIDSNYYNTRILPAIINEIISCNDPIAQEYLLESLIQVFPDDFQLAGLGHTLECICHLDSAIDSKKFFNELIDRICSSSVTDSLVASILSSYSSFINDCAGKNTHIPPHTLFALNDCLLSFLLRNKKDCLKEMEELFMIAHSVLSATVIELRTLSADYVSLLSQPIEQFGFDLLTMKSYTELIAMMNQQEAAGLAAKFAQYCFTKRIQFTDLSLATKVFDVFKYLVMRQEAEEHHLYSRCIHLLDLNEEDFLQLIPVMIETISSSLSTVSHIPLMTIAYLLMRKCSSPVYYTHLSTVLTHLRKVHARQAMIATMDVVSIADMKNETDVVKQFMDEATQCLDRIEGKVRVLCHPILLRGLTAIQSLSKEDMDMYAQRIEESDKAKTVDLESRTVVRLQSAVMYCTHTEKDCLYSEEKAKMIVEECKEAVKTSDLSAKEKNGAKAVLLQELIHVNTYCPAIVSEQSLKELYNEVMKSGRLSSATKKLLESIRVILAL